MLALMLILIIIIFVANSALVMEGAYTGLMLWFTKVIPLLLPFMLLSNLLTSQINLKKASTKKAILCTLFTGCLCGYPIGAYTSCNCINKGLYSKKTAELLLPICNNVSPMFISGYIVHTILNDRLSFYLVIFIIYLPYIIYTILFSLVYMHYFSASKKALKTTCTSSKAQEEYVAAQIDTSHKSPPNTNTNEKDIISKIILNISIIGFYIIMCSIIMEFLYQFPYSRLLACSLEITRGCNMSNNIFTLKATQKTALILSLTSFGGISSILQTNQVIKASGLSIYNYIISKIICAIASYFLTLLLI